MSKRKRVDVSTHSELTQYASLLRSLRTADTADLSSHLLPSNLSKRFTGSDDSDGDETNKDGSVAHLSEDAPPSTLPTTPLGSQFDLTSPLTSPSSIARTRWTRWPLLAGEVATPEFSFEQEVGRVATQAVQLTFPGATLEKKEDEVRIATQKTKASPSSDPVTLDRRGPSASHIDSFYPATPIPLELDENMSSHLGRALCDGTSKHLFDILGSAAALQPDVRMSMQERLKPVDWQDLLNVVEEFGLADAHVVSRVRARMLALFSDVPGTLLTRLCKNDSHMQSSRPLRAVCYPREAF